jgi:purine catabolism regulator
MALTVRQLVAEPALELELISSTTAARLASGITWVASSELVDPTPFLSGGELLLTTGAGIGAEDTDAWEAFVGRLAKVQVSGVGFGTGLTHSTVPPALARAAGATALPLFEVPYHVPFVKITRYVADALVSDRVRYLRRASTLASQLATSIVGGVPLAELLQRTAREIGGQAAVLDISGAVLASFPAEAEWDVSDPAGSRDGVRMVELESAGVTDHMLVARSDAPPQEVETLVSTAASLIAIDLSRRLRDEATNAGRMGMVLDALIDWTTPTSSLTRLLRVAGLSGDTRTLVVAAQSNAGDHTAFSLRLRLAVQSLWPVVRSVRRGETLLLLAQDGQPDSVAGLMSLLQKDMGRRQICVAGPAKDADELRLAVASALGRLPDSTAPSTVPMYDLTSIVASAVGRGAGGAAAAFLAPVVNHDVRYDSELLKTVRAYLRADGHPGNAAAKLHIHRNTLRYRLGQIQKLIDVDLQAQDGRTMAAIALRLYDAYGS